MTKEEKLTRRSFEPAKTRGSRDRHQKKDKPKPLTKVIIRRLPPTMTEEEFLKQIDPLPAHDFYYYSAADWSLGFDATCRAYITFQNHEDVFLFRDRFDGYVFVDTKGEEYPAIVEFAPFQSLPKNKARKIDPKVNTIETEQHYINFLQKLEDDREACKTECKIEFSLQPKDDKKSVSTPLLQFLMTKRSERREEQKKRAEENRRKREEEKQKRRNRVSKGIPSSIKEEATSSKDSKSKAEGTTDNPEEKKNSRAKRRAERDQRRREEHELRRREKDKERSAEIEQKALQTAEPSTSVKESEKPILVTKPPEGDHKRKEVKKYSERREKNRSKNSQASTSVGADGEPSNSTSSISIPADDKQPPGNDDQAMANFMKNLSSVKEFVPKHKQESDAATGEKTNTKCALTVADLEVVKQKLEKISLVEREHQKTPSPDKEEEEDKSERAERSQRNSSSSGGYANETKSEERFDRRIRNKDRPSIAIYQPGKTRLRLPEDGQSATDLKSNPTSDTESLKKEEQRSTAVRKVSRYSERRSGRAREGRRRFSGEDKPAKTSETTPPSDVLKEEHIEKPAEEKKDADSVENITE